MEKKTKPTTLWNLVVLIVISPAVWKDKGEGEKEESQEMNLD
jgi:hypothetical protein